MSELDRFREVSTRVRAFLAAPSAREALFRPSELEAWLDWDVDAFFDEALLHDFRRNFLGGGTMNWPNRRAEDERYAERDGVPVRIARARPSSLRRLYHDVRGGQHLWSSYRTLARRLPGPWHAAVCDNLVGQPFHLRLPGGRVLTEPVVRHGYYLGRLAESGVLSSGARPVILEIGAGYGGFARLVRRAVPGAVVWLVDLPQRLNLQAYYLARSFPDARVVAADDAPALARAFETRADFVLLPAWAMTAVPAAGVDVVVNTHSMQEMRPDQVDFYVNEIARICRGHFYCVNRYEKRIGQAVVRHPREALRDWQTVREEQQWNYPNILEGLYARSR